MNNYRYAGIEAYDINNGKGFGVTLFVQGCPHHCPGCHNPQTWDFNAGKKLDANTIKQLTCLFDDPNIVRLTISGGEPFANYEVTYSIASMFKTKHPEKQLWVYTGFTIEELVSAEKHQNLFELIDILVDGKFEIGNIDLSLPFRGSSNQRIIDIKKTKERNEIVLADI